jgi:hypothetical protein
MVGLLRARSLTSTATTTRTACSAGVNHAVDTGGNRPVAAQELRLSIKADKQRGPGACAPLYGLLLGWNGCLGGDEATRSFGRGLCDPPSRRLKGLEIPQTNEGEPADRQSSA